MNRYNSKRMVFVCQNDRGPNHPKGSCAELGSAQILALMKTVCKQNPERHIKAVASGCLGRCAEGPMCVIYPDNIWQTIRTPKEAEAWLEKNQ